MTIIRPEFKVVRGTSYSFSRIEQISGASFQSITALFERRAGILDDVTTEEAPQKACLTPVAIRDHLSGQLGDGIPKIITINGEKRPLFPRSELIKAAKAIQDLPRDVLITDHFVAAYFPNPDAWPLKPLDYPGLHAV